MDYLQEGQRAVREFIDKHPEHEDEAMGLLELFEMEVDSGESESHEYDLLVGSLDDLLIEDED